MSTVITHGLYAPEQFAVGDVVATCGGRRRFGIVDSIRHGPGWISVVVRWGTLRPLKAKAARWMKRLRLGESVIGFFYNPRGRTAVFKLRPDSRWLIRKDDPGCGLYCYWHREGEFAKPHGGYRLRCRRYC